MQGGKGKKQMWIRSFFLIFYGLCAGGLIAASFLAFLSMLGVIPRLAGLTKSMKNARMYESFVALGGILGTLVFLYRWQIKAGYPLLVLYGLFGGIFVGCMIGALAETIKSLPIFSRRLNLRSGIPYVIYGIAFGKMLGCWLYFYIFSENEERVIQVKKEPSKEEYQQIVKNLTPKHNSLLNCTKAFVTGGTFCVLGEVMKQLMMKYLNLSKKDSLLYVTIELILLSVLLTGFNFYGKITKFGGAGGLVPITGFANSVASAAIEYQKEGQVFGIGVKIFTIAGPVILYGIFSSFVTGLIYLFTKQWGWFL